MTIKSNGKSGMKPMRWQEVGLIVGGLLIGFAVGIETYTTFFLPADVHRNGLAMFIASSCGLVRMLSLFLIRAGINRENRPNDK
jgi:hypothetical protein